MSTLTVAKKDFTGARRSRTLWAAGTFLGVIAVLLTYARQAHVQSQTVAVQWIFLDFTQLLAVLLPIVALTASYLALAGEREGGGIKFLLSLPNTRRDVFAGKLLSRLAVVAAGVVFMYVAATSMALTKFGVFPASVIVGTLLVTILYGSVFVSVAVSLSAAAASRSRAIASALVAYFGLVILYILPVISVKNMVRMVHKTLLGLESNPDLYNAVEYTSPYLAYQKAMNLVVPADMQRHFFLDSAPNVQQGASRGQGSVEGVNPDLPMYLTDEFSLLILAFWIVVPLLVGYWAFERADLE